MTEPAIVLGPNQYGKAEVRVVKVTRDTARHEIDDLNVTSQLRGDFAAAHLAGDNAHVVATDTQKNTIFAFARDGIGSPEAFLLRLADHFTGSFDWVSRRPLGGGAVRVAAHPRAATPSTTTRSCAAARRCAPRSSSPTAPSATSSRAQGAHGAEDHRVGVRGLPEGPVHDPARDPRPHPRHGCRGALALRPRASVDYDAAYASVRALLLEAFAEKYSAALQATLFDMGRRVLERHPEIAEIRFSMPNKHHFVVDLSPFGLDNPNEVFFAADRPYGLIEAAVQREGVESPAAAWEGIAGFC